MNTKNFQVLLSAFTLTVAALGITVASPGQLLAAGDGHVPSIGDTLVFWSNFVVFFGALAFILRKPFLQFWQQRSDEIATAVNAGAEAEKQAQLLLEQAKARHAGLTDEVQELAVRIEAEGDAEAVQLAQDAKLRADSIQARAVEAIAAEKSNLEVRLREQLAKDVVEKAEALIRQKLGSTEDRALRQGVMSGLGQLGSKQ